MSGASVMRALRMHCMDPAGGACACSLRGWGALPHWSCWPQKHNCGVRGVCAVCCTAPLCQAARCHYGCQERIRGGREDALACRRQDGPPERVAPFLAHRRRLALPRAPLQRSLCVAAPQRTGVRRATLDLAA